MTAEQFWEGEPKLAQAYREADRLKVERVRFDEWRAGYYTRLAFGSAWSSDVKYPDFPLFVEKSDEFIQERKKATMRSNVAKMEAYMVAFNARFTGD